MRKIKKNKDDKNLKSIFGRKWGKQINEGKEKKERERGKTRQKRKEEQERKSN